MNVFIDKAMNNQQSILSVVSVVCCGEGVGERGREVDVLFGEAINYREKGALLVSLWIILGSIHIPLCVTRVICLPQRNWTASNSNLSHLVSK